MAHPSSISSTCVALAAALACTLPAWAQDQDTVVVTGRAPATAAVAGFGDAPLARTPLQASSYSNETLADSGTSRLSGLTRLDASASDAYNAEGY